MSKTLEMEVVPATDLSQRQEEFAQQFTEAYREAVSGLRKIIIFGLMCEEAKEIFGAHKVRPWIEEHCPDVKFRRVEQFRQLTRAIMEHAKNAQLCVFQESPVLALSAPEAEISPKARKFRNFIDTLGEDNSTYQLELQFGVRKANPQAPQYHPPKPQTAEQKAAAAEVADLKLAGEVLHDLVMWHEGKSWRRLANKDLKHVVDVMARVSGDLRKHLGRRKQ